MNSISKFLFDRRILFQWIVSFVLVSISFSIIYFHLKPQENPDLTVALHYNVLVGVDLYGKGLNFYLIPATGLVIYAINASMYRLLRHRQTVLAELATTSTLIVSALLLAAVLFLLSVN